MAELEGEQAHAALARLRRRAPVCWVPELGAWLVTGYAAASAALDDPARFTVEDPRFTTARVIGPSMLSLDGGSHRRHRSAFAYPLQPGQLRSRLSGFVEAESARLTEAIRPTGHAELRTELAGPLAVAVMAEALGLAGVGLSPETVLGWYQDIAAAVAALPVDPPGGAGWPGNRRLVHGAGGRPAPGDCSRTGAPARRGGRRRHADRRRGGVQRGTGTVRGG